MRAHVKRRYISQKMYDRIRSILADGFEKDLFESALYTLKDPNNKLRFNHFVFSLRDLLRHVLARLAPEEKVIDWLWQMDITPDEETIWTYRIKFALQNGYFDDHLLEFYNIDRDIADEIEEVKRIIHALTWYTYIDSKFYNLQKKEFKILVDEIIFGIDAFASHIISFQSDLRDDVYHWIDPESLRKTILNYQGDSFIFVPLHSIKNCEISKYDVLKVCSDSALLEVEGTIKVSLIYGSMKERENIEKYDVDVVRSFSFRAGMIYEIICDSSDKEYEVIAIDIRDMDLEPVEEKPGIEQGILEER